MTGRELDKYRREMGKILKSELRKPREPELMKLAGEVGVSRLTRRTGYGVNEPAAEPELIDNINDALRTEAMILASKTASKQFIISIIAAMASLVSALAAWTAILWEFRS